jgi:hypothetical protein
LEIEKKFTPRWNRWYLDDGNIGSDFKSLSNILNLIDQLGPKLGLHLNRSKCQIYGFQKSPPESLFPQVEIGKSSDFDTLGAPIGSPDHCSNFVSEKLLQTYNVLELLPKLNDAQIAFTLLRTCCSFGKVVYFLRTIPSNLIETICKEFDKKIKLCFENVLSFSPDTRGSIQASLPLSKGGTGLRSAFAHAPACYIASLSSARTFAKTKSNLTLKISTSIYDSFNKLVENPLTSDHKELSQRELSSQIDSLALKNLLSSSPEIDRARLYSILGPNANAWLSVIPSAKLGLSFSTRQFQNSMKLYLGLQVYPKDSACRQCQKPCDKYGIHSLICKNTGDMIAKHNSIRDVIYLFCKDAGLNVVKEKSGLLGDNYKDKRRPADVFISNFSLNSDYCLDIAITSPLQNKYVTKASNTEGYAATSYYSKKMSLYAKAVEAEDMTFQPIVFESYGRIAPESLPTLLKIAAIRADRSSSTRSQASRHLFQKISVALQIRNANMVHKRDSFVRDI